MAFNRQQFKDLIERVLRGIDLHSPAAVNLVLGTAAVESQFGTYIRQLGNGPALSPFQIEPPTFKFIRERYNGQCPLLLAASFDQLEWDLRLGIVVCRFKYRSIPQPLPDADDLPGLARYYKHFYNTRLGKATEDDFISAYERYVR